MFQKVILELSRNFLLTGVPGLHCRRINYSLQPCVLLKFCKILEITSAFEFLLVETSAKRFSKEKLL